MRCIHFFSFFIFSSTGLSFCYSLRLFYYTLRGDFNISFLFLIGEEIRLNKIVTFSALYDLIF
jgi:hypothetical protein